MADYAKVDNNVPRLLSPSEAVLVPGPPPYRVPVQNLPRYPDEASRNAIACYTIGRDTTPVPSDKQVIGQHLVYDQGASTVKWHNTLADYPLGERKREMHNQVIVKFESVLTAGYSHDFGAAFGGVHVLDTARIKKPEWIDYRNACKDMIDAGQGSAVMSVPIRTKAEPPVDLLVRANQGMTAMTGMREREGNLILHARQKDDAIRAAADHAALDAIDIDAGWPA